MSKLSDIINLQLEGTFAREVSNGKLEKIKDSVSEYGQAIKDKVSQYNRFVIDKEKDSQYGQAIKDLFDFKKDPIGATLYTAGNTLGALGVGLGIYRYLKAKKNKK